MMNFGSFWSRKLHVVDQILDQQARYYIVLEGHHLLEQKREQDPRQGPAIGCIFQLDQQVLGEDEAHLDAP